MPDVRYAVRLLRRDPVYAAVAILSMALGIAATTTLFSVAYGVLLKPLPWPEADRIMRVVETRADFLQAIARERLATELGLEPLQAFQLQTHGPDA